MNLPLQDRLIQVEQELQAAHKRQQDALNLAQALAERIAFLQGQHALLQELAQADEQPPSA